MDVRIVCRVSEKSRQLFYDNFDKRGPIFVFFFTVKLKKDLRRKLELKPTSPVKSVATL